MRTLEDAVAPDDEGTPVARR